MFGSVILEVAIGIIFIFILVSIICSCIREGIEALTKTRAAYLERGIRELLSDKQGTHLVRAFYQHPLIYSLFAAEYKPGLKDAKPGLLEKGGDLPSYIGAKNFALTIMDLAARGQKTDALSGHADSPGLTINTVRQNISNLHNPYVQRALLTAIDSSQGDLDIALKKIENWYDSAMDRVSGWYKRSTYWILFLIGLVVAISLNINTITIADYLFKNDGARKALLARAEAAAKDSSVTDQRYNDALASLDALHLPVGWANGFDAGRIIVPGKTAVTARGPNRERDEIIESLNAGRNRQFSIWNDLFKIILGWLITAIAATVGAPFWFDLLNKMMVIRSTVKPHEKSPEEGSEDRLSKKGRVRDILENDVNIRGEDPPRAIIPVAAASNAGPNIRDADSDIDNCRVSGGDITPDEDLPQARGGVKA